MRKKTLGTLLAAGALVLVAAGLGIRVWANDQLNAMPMFWAVHAAPDGRVLAELDDQLYIESEQGQSLSVIPLAKFGVKGFEGDFAILSDDSIILQKGELPPQSAHDVIRALARTRQEAPDSDSAGAVPLQRCSLTTMECTTLSGGRGDGFRVRRTFKLLVDEQAQRIYVADTDQQRLVALDYSGDVLSSKEGELQFPNQMQMTAPGELTVVDTNHNRFVTYSVSADGIGAVLKSVPQAEWLGVPMVDFFFPTGFVQTQDGSQFAILAGDNLTQGMLFHRSVEGGGATRIPLPKGADVLTLAATDDDVLVPDNGNYRLHAIGFDGADHGDFGSDVLNHKFDEYAAQHRVYAAILSYSLWIMLVLVAPLVYFAVRLQRAAEDGEDSPGPVTAPVAGAEVVDAQAVQRNGVVVGFLPLKVTPPFEFRRQWGRRALFNSRAGLAAASLPFLVFPLLVLYWDHAIHLKHPQAPSLFSQWPFVLVCIVGPLMLGWLWSSSLLERVYINRNGMVYQSPFCGPLEWLSFLRPSWALRWTEIAEVLLWARGSTRRPAAWFYLVRDQQGKVHRVSALAWKLHGQEDGNPQYFPGAWMDEEILRTTIYGTALYLLIGGRGQAPSQASRPVVPAARPAPVLREVPFWQTLAFFGMVFWLLLGALLFADTHAPQAIVKSIAYRAVWQTTFILITAGMLWSAVPDGRRGQFMGAHSVLVLFFGPLTVPFYLWSWYGWRRALRFTALAFVYFIAFGIAVESVNSVWPGTFLSGEASAATSTSAKMGR